jgi:hypothetical protein
MYKSKVEIELDTESSLELNAAISLPIKFWKKTQSKITYSEAFINVELISDQWKALIEAVQES